MSENPYETPRAEEPGFPASDDIPETPEDIWRKYLKHEAAVRSIGLFYYVCGGILMIFPIGIIAEDIARGLTSNDWALAAMALGIAMLPIAAATGLRRLMPWGRLAGIVLAAIGLLLFPVGTVIGGYIIYLLMRSMSSSVFSPEYKEIIAMTPQVKHKTSLFIWILLVISFSLFGLLMHLSH